MFCPNCRTEYRSGFEECADCRVPLVEELPPPPEPAEPAAEEGRWELNRSDSLGIAFVQGALIGYAIALMVSATVRFAAERFLISSGWTFYAPTTPVPEWTWLLEPLLSMLPPLRIVIGGYVARSRRLR